MFDPQLPITFESMAVYGRLMMARERLLELHPNYGSVAQRYSLCEPSANRDFLTQYPNIVVCVDSDFLVHYNDQMLTRWNDDELLFTWAHLACKQAMGFNRTFLHDPQQRDRRTLNFAMDLLVNATLAQLELGARPANALFDKRVYGEMTLDQVYDFVVQELQQLINPTEDHHA